MAVIAPPATIITAILIRLDGWIRLDGLRIFVSNGGKEIAMDSLQLSDEVIAGLTDEQMTVLQDLGELAAKKLKVSRAIEDFTAQIVASQKQMGFQPKTTPGGLHEDPEVLALITIKERYKLGNISEQIRRTLRRALDVGLGHLAVIQRQCQIYKVDPASTARRFYPETTTQKAT